MALGPFGFRTRIFCTLTRRFMLGAFLIGLVLGIAGCKKKAHPRRGTADSGAQDSGKTTSGRGARGIGDAGQRARNVPDAAIGQLARDAGHAGQAIAPGAPLPPPDPNYLRVRVAHPKVFSWWKEPFWTPFTRYPAWIPSKLYRKVFHVIRKGWSGSGLEPIEDLLEKNRRAFRPLQDIAPCRAVPHSRDSMVMDTRYWLQPKTRVLGLLALVSVRRFMAKHRFGDAAEVMASVIRLSCHLGQVLDEDAYQQGLLIEYHLIRMLKPLHGNPQACRRLLVPVREWTAHSFPPEHLVALSRIKLKSLVYDLVHGIVGGGRAHNPRFRALARQVEQRISRRIHRGHALVLRAMHSDAPEDWKALKAWSAARERESDEVKKQGWGRDPKELVRIIEEHPEKLNNRLADVVTKLVVPDAMYMPWHRYHDMILKVNRAFQRFAQSPCP